MGSFSSLQLGPLELTSSKNEFLMTHSELFQAKDLVVRMEDRFGEPRDEPRESYEIRLKDLVPRLELLGYTLERARREWEEPDWDGDPNPINLTFDALMTILRTVDVGRINHDFHDEFVEGAFTAPEIQAELRTHLEDVHFFTSSWDLDVLIGRFAPYTVLRVLAESPASADAMVVWDFYDVVEGGWVDRSRVTHGLDGNEHFLIVTEGSSDAKILAKALELLRPGTAEFFTFVDMDEGYPFSGTGNLVNFIKGLISIRITNKIVVIFDNNVEGVVNMAKCQALRLPPNLRIMKLPDLQAFKSFPTLGTTGPHLADINGAGAAIECYLDLDDDACVRWSAFNEARQAYQGALISKDRYKKSFLSQRQRDPNYDYSKLEPILDEIFAQCVAMA